MSLTAKNLLWVKNVKHEGGTKWAYMEQEHKDEFLLHFSKHWQIGADKPKAGEIILLFQKTEMPEYRGTYLTHLVTPIYENSEATDDPKYPRARWVKTVARASLPNPVKAPHELIFYKPNRGQVVDLTLIELDRGTSRRNGQKIPLSELQETIWQLFDGYFNSSERR